MVWGGGGSSLQSVDFCQLQEAGVVLLQPLATWVHLAETFPFQVKCGYKMQLPFPAHCRRSSCQPSCVCFVFLQVVGCSLQKDTAEKGLASFHSIYVLNF